MALLKHTITYGWRQTVQELPKELQAYWTFREEMTVENGLILKATRIVIPSSMRESTLHQLHEGHLGFGLASGQPPLLRTEKNERAATHDYKLNQDVMYLDPVSNK